MRKTLVLLVLVLCGVVACGPSEQEKQACANKKAAAREAWGSYAKALKAESDAVQAELVRLSQEAERQAVMDGASGEADPAAAAAARARAAPRIALADARRAYSRAVASAAGAAESVQSAYGGAVLAAVEAEATALRTLDEVGPAAERVATTLRGVPGGEGSTASPGGNLAGMRTKAQTAGADALAACEKLERE